MSNVLILAIIFGFVIIALAALLISAVFSGKRD